MLAELGMSSKSTPTDDRGTAESVQNLRYGVKGEARYRRGLARTTASKVDGAIRAISAYAGKSRYAVYANADELEGFPNPLAAWDDAEVRKPTGFAAGEDGGTLSNIYCERTTDWARSILVYGDSNKWPTDWERGSYVGRITLGPQTSGGTLSDASGNRFSIAEKFRDLVSDLRPIDTVTVTASGAEASGNWVISLSLSSVLGASYTLMVSNVVTDAPGSSISGNGTATPSITFTGTTSGVDYSVTYDVTVETA